MVITTLQTLASVLVFIGYYLNAKERTKTLSYVIWITSNAILSIISIYKELPIMSLMYIGMIIILIYNIARINGFKDLFAYGFKKREYRVVQSLYGTKAMFMIEYRVVYFGKIYTRFRNHRDIDDNTIKFKYKYKAVSFVEQLKLWDKGIKNIVA